MDNYAKELEKEIILLKTEIAHLKNFKKDSKKKILKEILGVIENVPDITVDTIKMMIEYELEE